jgi:NAD-dependent deacetylase
MDQTPVSFASSLIAALRAAQRLAVLTSAGVSAESGVPTFRDAQTGLWAKYDPTELATPQAFQADPRLVWEWYAWRRELVRRAEPNPAHLALVELERRVPAFTLITQNVDGLHQRAGSRNVIELHGNIQRVKCFDEGRLVEIPLGTAAGDNEQVPPRCPHCGAYLRPDVVWFGEGLPQENLEAAWEATQACQIFLSVGTSSLVQPAASLPYTAMRAGATVVEINPTETPLTPLAAYSLRGPAGMILPDLILKAFP